MCLGAGSALWDVQVRSLNIYLPSKRWHWKTGPLSSDVGLEGGTGGAEVVDMMQGFAILALIVRVGA